MDIMKGLKYLVDYVKEGFVDIGEDLKSYVVPAKPAPVKERIVEAEQVTTESLKSIESRRAYLTELITQCNSNVNLIGAQINSLNARLNALPNGGRGAAKRQSDFLRKELVWMKNKLEEETFMANYYLKLRG